MQLLLMRHGIAEDAGPATGHRDEPRRLTDQGAARMRIQAAGLARLEPVVGAVFTSPLVRCHQTAAIVGEALGREPQVDDRLRPGAELDDLEDLLGEHPGLDGALICGHQPDLSGLVAELTGGLVEFRKGTTALVQVDRVRRHAGVLRALYPPSALRALGVGRG